MKKDNCWKMYLEDNSRYADIINGIGCRGRQVVAGTDLEETDTESQGKARDLLRRVAFGVNFLIVGIENQETVDYKFPLRNMNYDVIGYQKEAKKIRKNIRKNPINLKPGEYLYGFKKDSKIHPQITFVLYTGEEPWDGPLCLHDILDFSDIPEELQEMVSDYRINVIDIPRWENTDVFQTDVRFVFEFIKCAKDKKALHRLVTEHPYYQSMDEDAYEVVTKYTNATQLVDMQKYEVEGGKKNVCKAIQDLMDDSREEGREEGRKSGVKALIETCQEFGSTKEATIIRLTDKFDMEETDACQYMELFWKETVQV